MKHCDRPSFKLTTALLCIDVLFPIGHATDWGTLSALLFFYISNKGICIDALHPSQQFYNNVRAFYSSRVEPVLSRG